METHTTKVESGFPILPVLFIVFLTLKLTSVISWSWLWVTAPIWGPFAVVLALFIVVVIAKLVEGLVKR